jgi:hypothetical protein
MYPLLKYQLIGSTRIYTLITLLSKTTRHVSALLRTILRSTCVVHTSLVLLNIVVANNYVRLFTVFYSY